MSDLWKAYDCLKVNHSLNFVDPNTGSYKVRTPSAFKVHVVESNEDGIPRRGQECRGSSTMEKIHFFGYIIKHITDLYEVRKHT